MFFSFGHHLPTPTPKITRFHLPDNHPPSMNEIFIFSQNDSLQVALGASSSSGAAIFTPHTRPLALAIPIAVNADEDTCVPGATSAQALPLVPLMDGNNNNKDTPKKKSLKSCTNLELDDHMNEMGLKYKTFVACFSTSRLDMPGVAQVKADFQSLLQPLTSHQRMDDIVRIRDYLDVCNRGALLLKVWKRIQSFTAKDLGRPSASVVNTIMDFNQNVQVMDGIAPSSIPTEMHAWLRSEAGRQLLRTGDFAQAFADSGCPNVETLGIVARVEVTKQQIDFVEVAIATTLSQYEGVNFNNAIDQLIGFFRSFNDHKTHYMAEVSSPMCCILKVIESDDDCSSHVDTLTSNRRAPVFRSFMYHASSKLGGQLVERARNRVEASKKSREAGVKFTEAKGEVDAAHATVKGLVDKKSPATGLESRAVSSDLVKNCGRWLNTFNSVSDKHIGQAGCTVKQEDVMGVKGSLAQTLGGFASITMERGHIAVCESVKVLILQEVKVEDILCEEWHSRAQTFSLVRKAFGDVTTAPVIVEFCTEASLSNLLPDGIFPWMYDFYSKVMSLATAGAQLLGQVGMGAIQIKDIEEAVVSEKIVEMLKDEAKRAALEHGIAEAMQALGTLKRDFALAIEAVPSVLNRAASDKCKQCLEILKTPSADIVHHIKSMGDFIKVMYLKVGRPCFQLSAAKAAQLAESYVSNAQPFRAATKNIQLDLMPVCDTDVKTTDSIKCILACPETDPIRARLAIALSDVCEAAEEHAKIRSDFEFDSLRRRACRLLERSRGLGVAQPEGSTVSGVDVAVQYCTLLGEYASLADALQDYKREYPAGSTAKQVSGRVAEGAKMLKDCMAFCLGQAATCLKTHAEKALSLPKDWKVAISDRNETRLKVLVNTPGKQQLVEDIRKVKELMKDNLEVRIKEASKAGVKETPEIKETVVSLQTIVTDV